MNNHRNGHSVIPIFGERTSYFLWIIMLSLLDIFTAYYDCRRHKRNTYGAIEFELHYESECIKLWQEIQERRYTLRPCTAFIVRDPVKREIFASHFRDRVIHHLISRRLEPILERVLIHDVYNSRKGKGTHYGVKRIEKFMRSCSDNYGKDAYILKLDISGFFMSIEKERLWEKVKILLCHPQKSENYCSDSSQVLVIARNEAIQCSFFQKPGLLRHHPQKQDDSSQGRKQREKQKPGIPPDEQETLLYLIKIIIFSDVKKDVIIKGKRSDWIGLPKTKSLFYAKPGCGLPIGNLTSQLFSSIYMHEFDTFVKKTLHIKYYGRYVDDFILIHYDREYLKSCIPKIRAFLDERLSLTLHPKKIYLQHISKGVLFLGTYIKPWRKYVGKRTKGNFYRVMEGINTRFLQEFIPVGREGQNQGTDSSFFRMTEKEQSHIHSQVNSYLGLMKHTASYRLRKRMIKKFSSEFWKYFRTHSDYYLISLKK